MTADFETPSPSTEPLEVQVGHWLRKRGLKLVAAESCTGGLIGHLITNVPGSSDYYLGSVTAYAYEAKQNLLGVKLETLQTYGAVSEETVIEMARGARQALAGHFSVDNLVGVSVSGIAGPGGAMPDKPVGLVWIGLSGPGLERGWKYTWNGDRVTNKELSAQQALQILLGYLQSQPDRNKGRAPMIYEPVEVAARWEPAGGFTPRKVSWQGRNYTIESTGRSWEDEEGLHILCMVAGGQVIELLFRLRPAGWLLRVPSGSVHAS